MSTPRLKTERVCVFKITGFPRGVEVVLVIVVTKEDFLEI
jgi:hypothetical protein